METAHKEPATKTLDVLLVARTTESVMALGQIVAGYGHTVRAAKSYDECVRAIHASLPDVIYLDFWFDNSVDLQLPGLLRRIAGLDDTTIVAHHRHLGPRASKSQDIDLFLGKPTFLMILKRPNYPWPRHRAVAESTQF